MRIILVILFASLALNNCFATPSSIKSLPGCEESSHRIDLVDLSMPVMVGEWHGTEEYPRFIRQIACSFLALKKPVLIGLEIPVNEQTAITTYISSDGGLVDRKKLLSGDFWNQNMQDGRASRAIFGLIEFVRLAKLAGLDLALFAYDVDSILTNDQLDRNERGRPWTSERDIRMAINIEARMRQYPDYSVVVLSGDVHTREVVGNSLDPNYESMAVRISSFKKFQSLSPVHREGTSWSCKAPTAESCGTAPARAFRAKAASKLDPGVGFLTASPPAISQNGNP